ncbi:MAG TPA: LysR family transcriptional regulator [Geothrix sp.]|nr:LysR family transcriptional regulator [Geothrix sp.]
MQFRHLETFAMVAATLNVTRAAERLHLAQSSVTEQVQALEQDLGTALFDRSGRKLALTPAGVRLLAYAQELLDLAAEARNAVAKSTRAMGGTLRLGTLETLASGRVPALLAAYSRAHPGVKLVLGTGNSRELRERVKGRAVDAAFVLGPPGEDSDLQEEPVGEERLVLAVPPGHRLEGLGPVRPADLAAEAFLATEPGCVYRQLLDRAFEAAALPPPRIVGEFSSLGTVRFLVEAGSGCALVPFAAVAEAILRGSLVALPWDGPLRSAQVTLLWRRHREPPPALGSFLAMARQGPWFVK